VSDDKEREDLEALLQSPGWLRYRNAMQKEYVGRFEDYVTAAITGKGEALTELLKLSAARTAVLSALRYPDERIRQLLDAEKSRVMEQARTFARGGLQ